MLKKVITERIKTGAAAKYLGVARRHLQSITQKGEIPYYRLGLRLVVYNRFDLDQYLKMRRISAEEM